MAERIRYALAKPCNIGDTAIELTASIGIACGLHYERLEQALRDADVAMYEAKARGRNQYVLFEETRRTRSASRQLLETELRQAIERQEFFVLYQPIVALTSLRVVGFEALVRWRHPQRGILLAAEFIPAAEQTGLIVPIDRWVFETAAR